MSLEERIKNIEERNLRVDEDKRWEVSFARRGFIALVTYLTTAIVFTLLKADLPFLQALIPTLGYLLSCLSLPFVRKAWLKR